MGADSKEVRWNRVLIDVCTQRDYLDSGAILQVANRDELLVNLKEVFRWVKASGLPVVSSVESHRPTEPLNGFPLHCIDGTVGQEKLGFTMLSPWVLVETDNYLSLPPDLAIKFRQIIFRKRSREVLTNPKADRFLTQLSAEEFILCGVGIERAVKSLALGLLARHKPVTVIADACGYWSAADGDLACRQLAAKGVRLVSTAQFTAPVKVTPKPARRRRAAVVNRHDPRRSEPDRRQRTDVSKR